MSLGFFKPAIATARTGQRRQMLRRWSIPLTTAVIASVPCSGLANGACRRGDCTPPGDHTRSARRSGARLQTGWPHAAGRLARRTPRRSRAIAIQAESTNWSGYAVTGANGAFKQRVRQLDPADRDLQRQPARSDQYAAFWVGLDGYSSDSVEQTGTDSDCDGRHRITTAGTRCIRPTRCTTPTPSSPATR